MAKKTKELSLRARLEKNKEKFAEYTAESIEKANKMVPEIESCIYSLEVLFSQGEYSKLEEEAVGIYKALFGSSVPIKHVKKAQWDKLQIRVWVKNRVKAMKNLIDELHLFDRPEKEKVFFRLTLMDHLKILCERELKLINN